MNNPILNTLTLQPVGQYGSLGLVFDPVIDGISLLARVTKFESEFSSRLAGAYCAALGQRDVLNLQNLGETFMPYACDCGEWHCWFLTAKVTGFGDFIYWGSFSNPRRNDKSRASEGLYWSYREFGMLCSDKAQYTDEVLKAQALVNAHAT